MSDEGLRLTVPLLEHPRAVDGRTEPCQVCGGLWKPSRGSRLPCHPKCLLTESELRRINLTTLLDFDASTKIAESLGLSFIVFRALVIWAWKNAPAPDDAKKKRGKP